MDIPDDPHPPTHYAPGWEEAAATRARARRRVVVGVTAVATVVVLAVGTTVGTRAVTAVRSRPLPSDVTASTDAYAVQLVTGSCLATLPDDGEVDRVDVVPCDDPHAAQVVAQYAFDPAAVWPGQEGAHARVERACVLSDEEVAAGVRLVTWAPTAGGWSGGDRTGLCVAVPPAPVTGSFVDGTAAPAG
ncbi:septum formation family protein [Cellulomonas dongxiuzhuiae]|uniref:septum formation family protein n=1 Tax=Cellulomonas dongxiuzhuiae TaxID=2819979 RepID=UPI001FB98578|nr:septum formation family protein [Cellulomonas dongxiuzhuiae]